MDGDQPTTEGPAEQDAADTSGDRPWVTDDPDRLVRKGHGAGDVLEAWRWRVLRRDVGLLEVEAHLPEGLKNPQGQLFGGFTTTYVDFVSLHTVHSLDPGRDPTSPKDWLTTINMRCDYFEPIFGPTFRVLGEVVNTRGRTSLVSAKFWQDDTMAAHAITTLRRVPPA
ncbi:MAG: PaaI family thioesterase [Actinomycetota bacterium]